VTPSITVSGIPPEREATIGRPQLIASSGQPVGFFTDGRIDNDIGLRIETGHIGIGGPDQAYPVAKIEFFDQRQDESTVARELVVPIGDTLGIRDHEGRLLSTIDQHPQHPD
jgi:hypothetical protein